MSRFIFNAVLLAAASVTLLAQPAVNDGGILNAASYTNAKLPGGGIAQGSIFVVFGARMGQAALASAPSLPLSTNLAGTAVRVTSGGQTLDCPLVYVSAGQLAAILPSTTPVSASATLTVTYNGASSTPRTFRVVASSFGTFSLNQGGSGPGVITNYESAASQPVNTALKPARPSQTLILYGTGLGPLPSGSDANAAPAVAINQANVELYVGGRRASVAYAGRAPGFVGLDQVNFVVPAGIEGCSVPVGIKIGNTVSNYTSIAIAASGNVCQDPLGLSSAQLERIANGGTLKLGTIGMARADLEMTVPFLGTLSIKTDTGTASFVELNATTINSGAQLGTEGVSSIGTCYVYSGSTGTLTPVDPIQPRGLNAGALINVNGPKGAKTLKPIPNSIGNYSETLALGGISIPGVPGQPNSEPYLEPGSYTFNNGGGGTDVGAFNTNFTLPQNITWTNKAAIANVNRANGTTVTWTGGDPNSFVQIYGFSVSDTSNSAVAGYFTCLERANVGTFTVPAAILLALPATPTGGEAGVPLGTMGVGGVSALREFTAPGLDYAYVVSVSVAAKSVNFQ